MGWRIVVVFNTVKLDYEMGYLCIRSKEDIKRIYIEEISTLVIENISIALTAYLLVELANNKVNIIFCDKRGIPNGVYTSLYGSHDTSKSIRKQIAWIDAQKQMIWKSIIERKILGQSFVLKSEGKIEAYEKLLSYIPQIEFGDNTNREGHAAKVYFNALFGVNFSRDDDESPINAALNYGYAILLSSISREIVSNGYLTQIGIFHNNIFNELNLACDLMEPFRPFVDKKVLTLRPKKFEHEEKMKVIDILNMKIKIEGREQFLSNAFTIYVKSILNAIDNANPAMIKFPEYYD